MIINNHIPSDFAAEALACFQAAQMGLNLGFLEAVIEGDALILVKRIYVNNQDGSVISVYIMDSKSLSANYRRCVFVHALGKGNGVAHIIATEGIHKGETTYLLEEVPSLAIDAVEKDRWWTNPPYETLILDV